MNFQNKLVLHPPLLSSFIYLHPVMQMFHYIHGYFQFGGIRNLLMKKNINRYFYAESVYITVLFFDKSIVQNLFNLIFIQP